MLMKTAWSAVGEKGAAIMQPFITCAARSDARNHAEICRARSPGQQRVRVRRASEPSSVCCAHTPRRTDDMGVHLSR
jgi:hypothetical protein